MPDEIYRLALVADGRVAYFATAELAEARAAVAAFLRAAPPGFAVGLLPPSGAHESTYDACFPGADEQDEGFVRAVAVLECVPAAFGAAFGAAFDRERLVRREGGPWARVTGGGVDWSVAAGRCGPVASASIPSVAGYVPWAVVAEGWLAFAESVFNRLWETDKFGGVNLGSDLEVAVSVLNATPSGPHRDYRIEPQGEVSHASSVPEYRRVISRDEAFAHRRALFAGPVEKP